MMEDNSKIGKSLLSHAETKPLPTVSQTTALLPYMVVASRRMSARDISRFFKDQHNIDISHSTIARALKNSKEHYQKIADFLEHSFRRIPTYFEARASRLFALEREWRPVYEDDSPLATLQKAIVYRILEAQSENYEDTFLIELEGIVSTMIELWDDLPEEAQCEIFSLLDKSDWQEGYEYEWD